MPSPACRCSVLYQGKKTWPKPRESWIDPKRSGNAGRYFIVLNCASEKGLSFDTEGREWVLVTPRSESSSATGFEVIEDPRSACSESWPGRIACRAQLCSISFFASAALSSWATIQPTTYLLNMSRIT